MTIKHPNSHKQYQFYNKNIQMVVTLSHMNLDITKCKV